MTASSRGDVGTSNRMRFSLRAVALTIAVVTMAVVAIVLIPMTAGGPGPAAFGPPDPTATVEVSPAPTPEATVTLMPTPTQAPAPSLAPTPTAIPRWTGMVWSDPVTPSFVVHLNDLVPWECGYVAIGEIEVDATRTEAAFLTSADGLNWLVRHQVDPGADRFPRHLVVAGDELLAFSHPNTDALALHDASEPLIWTSVTGTSWSLLDSQSWRDAWSGPVVGPMPAGWDLTQYPIPTGLVDVVSGSDGLVAIGNSYGDGELVPVVLHSPDGRVWGEAALPADATSPLLADIAVHRGGFVLVGAVHAGPRSDTARPAAWASTDGRSWTGTAADGDPAIIGELGRVVSGVDGLLAWAGAREMHSGPRFTSVWTSRQGLMWSPAEVPAGPFGLVQADGTRIVALGPMPNMAADPALWPGVNEGWSSTDGVSWTVLDMPHALNDFVERMWVVPDGVIYAGVQSFWVGSPTMAP